MKKHTISILLTLTAAVYPVIFLYSNNADILSLNLAVLPLGLALLLGLVLYGAGLLLFRKPQRASLGAAVFILAFYTYGSLYQYLVRLDRFPVDHFTLLPVVLVAAGYLGGGLAQLKRKTAVSVQNVLLLCLGGLIAYNVISAVPVEIKKAQIAAGENRVLAAGGSQQAGKQPPDIYYFIFDEYAGLDSLRRYWHEDAYADGFKAFLQERGFIVTENSRGATNSTLVEMASRLNLRQFPADTGELDLYQAISDNALMPLLKTYGYTTVAFNPIFKPIQADHEFVPGDAEQMESGPDEFHLMLVDLTMLSAYADSFHTADPNRYNTWNMFQFSMEKAVQLADIPSPKFVYIHLSLPHMPFIVDENGQPVDPKNEDNWNFYLGQHKYVTGQIELLVDRLLEDVDPANPPVIILQSDHGARNVKLKTTDNVILENYPMEHHTNILNALYLPGLDPDQVADDITPIDTMKLILNHYLDAGLTAGSP